MRLWTLLLALPLLIACPTGGGGAGGGADDDDDDATSPEGHDQAVTVDGPPECAPIEAAIYTSWAAGGPVDHTIRASGVADYCAVYRAYWEAWTGSFPDYESYTFAMIDQDGPAACSNLRTFLTDFQAAHDAVAPPGTCTLEVYLPTYGGPGTWSTLAEDGGLRIGSGQVWYAGDSRIGTILELLGDCSAVTSWDDWIALTSGQFVDRWRSVTAWVIEIGEMELAEDGDDWAVEAEGMVIEEPASGTQGGLGFDLVAGPCQLDSWPPGF